MIGAGSLLRLGGRLRNAAIEYSEKYPVILPKHFGLDRSYRVTLHDGTQLTLRTLRQEYWIVDGRNLVKAHIHRA